MNAIILTVGDELLIGQVINTNAAFIAEQLGPAGIDVIRVVTVGDEEDVILDALREHVPRADATIVTGGLGPTHDDVTRAAVCKLFGVGLVASEEAREGIKKFLQKRNYPWTAAADDQVLMPAGARVIPNAHGTAPGELFERDGKVLIVMPGVPYEMEAMVKDFLVPFFTRKSSGSIILHRTLKTSGVPESVLASRLHPVSELLRGQKLAFLPSPSGVRMRITVRGNDRAGGEKILSDIEGLIREKVGDAVYGTDDEELEQVVGRLLKERGLRIAVAESCTGGLVADKITDVPGSSDYFDRGIVTYSNKSKTDILSVPEALLKSHGAVSREVAAAMAEGIRNAAGVDIGLSTTGIAGPGGGSEEKPVGLVWIGYADRNGSFARKFRFGEGRLRVKERASQAALEVVRKKLLGIE